MENVPHVYVKKIEIFNEICPFSIVMLTSQRSVSSRFQGITCFLSSRIGMLIAIVESYDSLDTKNRGSSPGRKVD